MAALSIEPIAIFDVSEKGIVPVVEDWPDARPGQGGFRWIHFDVTTANLQAWLDDKLPDLARATLLQRETRPRCEVLEDALILNLRGVNLNPEASPEDMVSVRVWATATLVVTVRTRKVWAIDELRKGCEAHRCPRSVAGFLAALIHGLSKRIEAVSLEIEEEVDALEEANLDGALEDPKKLNHLRLATIKLRRYIGPQREALETLAIGETGFLDEPALVQIRESANRTRRILEEVDASRERLSAIQDHFEAAQGQIMNRNGYLLSVMAAIFLPLGFLTGLFGVNVAGMPGLDHPMAFWALSLATAGIGIALYLIFKWLRWL